MGSTFWSLWSDGQRMMSSLHSFPLAAVEAVGPPLCFSRSSESISYLLLFKWQLQTFLSDKWYIILNIDNNQLEIVDFREDFKEFIYWRVTLDLSSAISFRLWFSNDRWLKRGQEIRFKEGSTHLKYLIECEFHERKEKVLICCNFWSN